MRFTTPIFVLFFTLSLGTLKGQHKAKVWDTSNGLSNNWISDIAQDDQGYLWLATQYGVNRFDGYAFKSFTHDPENSNSPIANWVKRIVKKSKNELWFGVDYGGLDVYDSKKDEFNHKSIVHQKDTITSINKLLHSTKGGLYIATKSGLFKERAKGDAFDQLFEGTIKDIRQNSNGTVFFLSNSVIYTYDTNTLEVKKVFENSDSTIQHIFIDSEDQLFGLYSSEIVVLQFSNGSYIPSTQFKISPLVSLLFADNAIMEDSEHRIWIGGQKGISIVNKSRNAVAFYPYQTFFEKDIPGIQALSFYEDIHKNMWIGTNKGLAFISSFMTRFPSNKKLVYDVKLHDIRAFHEVNNHLLVAADEGLFRMDEKKQIEKILSPKVYGMHKTRSGALYAIGVGLFEIDTASFRFKTISTSYFKGAWSIGEDQTDNLWMIANENLIRYHKSSQTFETFSTDNTPTLHNSPRIDLMFDSRGRLWLCTLRSGIYVLKNPHEVPSGGTPVFENINHEVGNANSLSNRLATSLLEASDGTIWVGTDAGLNAIDPNTFDVKRYLKKDGLKDEKIMAILEDDYGNIWGSTVGNGIFQFNKKTGDFNFLGKEDGLISNNFLLSSAYKNTEGILFFGSDNGIQEIDPVLFDTFSPPKVDFFFTSVQPSIPSTNKRTNLFDTENKEITLDYDNNSFLVNYTTLNYHLAEKTKYRYRVANLNNTWQDNGSERSITFNSLPVGAYELQVAATNPDLEFTGDTIRLKFIVKPPWWRTNWAYLVYFLVFAAILLAVHHYVLKGKLERAEKIRLQELNTFKTNFFNNVAHELKTPLTLISGMAKTLRKNGGKEMDKSVKTIMRSSNELNDLVNQLLDLSKLEVGKLHIEMAHGDIIVFLKYLVNSFESLASAKEIRLHFLSDAEILKMDFDAQKIKHIFSNLISNAIKNTPVKGDIYFQVTRQGDHCCFDVKDNGIGIPEEELPRIFERYHQVKGHTEGTGIGLSFTKELVELMKGTIVVKSALGKGTNFKVSLPIEHKATKEIPFETGTETIDVHTNDSPTDFGRAADEYPIIHIIEDNLDICSYLELILKQDYRLSFDHNGESGLSTVIETVPDLVITDLMMPIKNGFEVCQTIKSNRITDHIPVIMLTAKSDTASKLEGLKLGADAYLEKPFDERELLLQIVNLLEQREVLRKKYQNQEYWENNANSTLNEPNEFVLKVRKLIEENIDNSQFGILEICRALGISRSHLHRKLKALTDLSSSLFIQKVKLQRAKQLLKSTEMNISEVAYEVGFEDPAYFSRQFSKTFGYPPSETRKNI